MIKVRFFGMLGVDNNVAMLEMDNGTVKQVLDLVREKYPSISEKQLSQAVLFLNKEQLTGQKRFSTILKDADELALLSPASGG